MPATTDPPNDELLRPLPNTDEPRLCAECHGELFTEWEIANQTCEECQHKGEWNDHDTR